MAKTRTPTQTKDHVARSGGRPRQTTMYKKSVTMDLYGNDPAELQKVAAVVRKAASGHDLCIGGKLGRRVTVSHGDSFTPKKVFDGVVG